MNLYSHSARPVRPRWTAVGRRHRFSLVLVTLIVAGPLAGCGKKGPPLPPLIRVPAASDNISARRLGETVYVRLTIPGRNQDNSTPADITRVEVYGYTGTPAVDDDYVKYGTLVASIPVRKPPAENEQAPKKEPAATKGPADKKESIEKMGPASRDLGADQGAAVTVSEKLTPALLQPVVRPPSKTPAARPGSKETALDTVSQVLTRVYVAVGRNHKGKRGVFSRPVGVSIAPAPAPPTALKLTYTDSQINLAWTAADQPAGAEARSSPAQPLAYNVYAAPAPVPAPQPAEVRSVGAEGVPAPLNDKPIVGTTFPDPRLEFDTERCYEVRAVASTGTAQVESEPSAVVCVTPKDVFPPAAPKGLTAVTSAGAINLLWEPNTEPDLNGYLVLRGEAPGGTLQPITAQPIHETTFNDTTVKAGVRYVYAIVAVDKSGNIGAQSNRVEETGR